MLVLFFICARLGFRKQGNINVQSQSVKRLTSSVYCKQNQAMRFIYACLAWTLLPSWWLITYFLIPRLTVLHVYHFLSFFQ